VAAAREAGSGNHGRDVAAAVGVDVRVTDPAGDAAPLPDPVQRAAGGLEPEQGARHRERLGRRVDGSVVDAVSEPRRDARDA
jgi:hypothetical protein